VEWSAHPPSTTKPSITASPPDIAPASLVQGIFEYDTGLLDGFTLYTYRPKND